MNFDEKPTVESIRQMVRHLEGVWSRTHAKWQVVDSYYQQEYRLWPEGLDRPEWLKPARSRSIVDHATDHQLAHDPIVSRPATGDEEEDRAKADRVEPALKSILDEAALLEPTLTWKQAGKHMLLYGYAVIEDALDTGVMQARRNKIRRGKGESDEEFNQRQRVQTNKSRTMMPFRVRAPHPSRVLLDPSEKEPRIAIKHGRRRSIDLEEITKSRMSAAKGYRRGEVTPWECGEDPFAWVKTEEYWTDCWHALVADSELLFVEKNTWGFVPFSHAFAGFGQQVTAVDEDDPSYLAVGILEPVMPSLRAQAQAVAGRHNALLDATFNPVGTTMDAAELQEQLARGDIVEMGTRGDVWRMDIPQLPRWLFASEEWLDRDIEQGTFTRALAGIREQGVSTVGQQAILSTAAGRKFVSPSRQLEHLATTTASHILQWIDVIGMTLHVQGNSIAPSDIQHDYSCKVSFELIDPVLQMQSRELGMREVQQGLKSKETYWSADARLEDATGERRRLLQDLIRTDPEVQRVLAAEVMKESGILDLVERQRASQEEAAAGPMGGGGPPGGMPGGMPGGPPGGMMGGNGQPPPVLGPDGMPMDQTMGTPPGPAGGLREIRQGLTPSVPRPSRVGQNLAG